MQTRKKEIVFLSLMFLCSSISFVGGMLAAKYTIHAPIIIEQCLHKLQTD